MPSYLLSLSRGRGGGGKSTNKTQAPRRASRDNRQNQPASSRAYPRACWIPRTYGIGKAAIVANISRVPFWKFIDNICNTWYCCTRYQVYHTTEPEGRAPFWLKIVIIIYQVPDTHYNSDIKNKGNMWKSSAMLLLNSTRYQVPGTVFYTPVLVGVSWDYYCFVG